MLFLVLCFQYHWRNQVLYEYQYYAINFSKRPYAEECHDHRWLISSDYMIKKRERAVFLGNRLRVITVAIIILMGLLFT